MLARLESTCIMREQPWGMLHSMCFGVSVGELVQVMKAGITAAQRRRRGDNALRVAVDPHTRRLLRLEEARSWALLSSAVS